jgi:hypothetical protein
MAIDDHPAANFHRVGDQRVAALVSALQADTIAVKMRDFRAHHADSTTCDARVV